MLGWFITQQFAAEKEICDNGFFNDSSFFCWTSQQWSSSGYYYWWLLYQTTSSEIGSLSTHFAFWGLLFPQTQSHFVFCPVDYVTPTLLTDDVLVVSVTDMTPTYVIIFNWFIEALVKTRTRHWHVNNNNLRKWIYWMLSSVWV